MAALADDAGTADALAARIEAVGGACCRVSAGDVLNEHRIAVGSLIRRTANISITPGARWVKQWQRAQRVVDRRKFCHRDDGAKRLTGANS